MKVSSILEVLKNEDPNSEIMIQLYTKQDVESLTNTQYAEVHWNLAVRLFDKWDTGIDELGVTDCLIEAKERLVSL